MRNILLFTLLYLSSGSLNAQKLAGVVYDRANRESVPGAHVYLEGSSLYDVTNADGRFEITVNAIVNLPLVISHISYQTTAILNPFTALPDTIFVIEKETSLGEVVVEAGRYSRRQLFRAFRREFLGTSTAAQSCIIGNEEKIDIWFNRLTHTLSASCDEPVLIHNKYLGYKIYVTLEKFEVVYPGRQLGVGSPLLIDFEGSTLFEDMASSNRTISNRRKNTFIGSPPHFLRALAVEKLEDFDYYLLIKGDLFVKKPSDCFTVIDMDGGKKVLVNPLLIPANFATYHGFTYHATVQVQRARKEETEVIFFSDTFFIDAWGTLGKDMLFVGYMGSLRFGDKLPADYGIEF